MTTKNEETDPILGWEAVEFLPDVEISGLVRYHSNDVSFTIPQNQDVLGKIFRVAIISDAKPRDRYFIVRNSLKVVFDNEVTEEDRKRDRLCKIIPLIDRIWTGCMKQSRQQELAIDEMMMPFHGTCGIKELLLY